MGRIGLSEIILIALVIILFFGAKKLPEIARAIGQSLKEFKKASGDTEDKIKDATKEHD